MKQLCEITDKDVLGLDEVSYATPRRSVGAVLYDNEGKIALVYYGSWGFYSLPGGGVEHDESLHQAVIREVQEETGCQCVITAELGKTTENRFQDNSTEERYFFMAQVMGKKGTPHLTEREAEAKTTVEWHIFENAMALLSQPRTEGYRRHFMQRRDIAVLNEVAGRDAVKSALLQKANAIKMIVVDLDSTLLKDDKSVSMRARNALIRCRQLGLKTVYATGRGKSASVAAPQECFDAAVINNGAFASIAEESVYSKLIGFEMLRPFLVACARRGLDTVSQHQGIDYANFTITDRWPAGPSEVTNYRIVDFSTHDIDAEKAFVMVDTAEDTTFVEEHLPEPLVLTITRDGMAMVTHKEANKSLAVAELARLWDIESFEIAAFGDDRNDLELLRFAGIGVAMSNAVGDVKAIADYITLSNEEDGVAVWLEENILSRGFDHQSTKL